MGAEEEEDPGFAVSITWQGIVLECAGTAIPL